MNLVLELRPPESRFYGSWQERLETVARLRRPDEVHALCEQAHALGVRTILAVLDDTIREALIAFQRWREVEVWAVLPNMFAFIRDLTDLGMVGAARARFLRLTPAAMTRTTLGALGNLGSIRRRDFVTGALLVADMEMAALRGLRVTRLLLHPQLTEIALAGGLPTLFTELATRAARQGMEAGIVTHNPVRAATVLGADLTHFPVVIAPCNPRGYKMFPDREPCEQLFRSDPGRFFANELTAGGSVPVETALAHVQELGLAGAVLDVRAVETAYREGGLGVGTATGAV